MTGSDTPQLKVPQTRPSRWVLLALGGIILCTAAIRIRLLSIPLERDEGEYAYAGQLILQGIPPYELAYNMKLPGIYAAYAVILALFGQTHIAIHFGLLLVNAATILLVFLLARYFVSSFCALSAAASFAFLSVSKFTLGFTANAEHFVLLPALGGTLILFRAILKSHVSPISLVGSGFLLGMGFIIKQHGIFFFAFGFVFLFLHLIRSNPKPFCRNIFYSALFLGAGILPYLLTCWIMYRCGVFDAFWFWTVSYAREYVNQISLMAGLWWFKQNFIPIMIYSAAIWSVVFLGFFMALLKPYPRKWLLLGFSFFSALAVCPGLYFRPHYFIFILPAAALLFSFGLQFLSHSISPFSSKRLWSLGIPLLIFTFSLLQQWSFLFITPPFDIVRNWDHANAFCESLEISRFIQDHSQPDDTIAIIGSEPQIFFYAHRHSATGYIYLFPLLEKQPYAPLMQSKMIHEIESDNPAFLIDFHIYSFKDCHIKMNKVLQWAPAYIDKHYTPFACVDIFGGSPTQYYWGPEALTQTPKSQYHVIVYKRNDTGVQ